MATLDNAIWFGPGGYAENGSTVVSQSGNTTTVTGTFTAEAWDASQAGHGVSEFGAFGVAAPIMANFKFSNPVEALAFDFQHVNGQGATQDDNWTIYAYDENGTLIPAVDVIAGLSGLVDETVIANPDGSVSIDANGATANDVHLLLPGRVSQLNLVFQNGPDAAMSGGSGISDFTFSVPVVPDFIVEGTAGADLIDADYLGDPEGDKIDNGDAADLSDDDSVEAGAGNDTVRAGLGNDTIHGGDGDDSLFGNEGDDSIEGGAGNDSIYGELGADLVSGGAGDDHIEGNEGDDTLFGGDGNDWLRGSYDNDDLWGGAGDDYLWGGFGDDVFHIETGFGNDTIDAEGVAETAGDTLDLSLVTDDLSIDLTGANPEAGTFTDGVSTAHFDEIETIVLGGGQDTIILADFGGNDTVSAFEAPTDNGDGTFTGHDRLDVAGLTSDYGTTPVTVDDVSVTDDGSGNAVLSFPGGESLTLTGVSPASLSSPAALEAMGIPTAGTPPAGETLYDAIRLDGLPGGSDLLSAGNQMLSVQEPLSFAVAAAGQVNIGDTTVIGGTVHTVSAIHDYEADLISNLGSVTETVHGHILELADGAGGGVTLMLIDDGYGDKPQVTEAQMIFVDPAKGGAAVAGYDTNQNVTLFAGDDVVEGTAGADLINDGYTGDPEGDRIDAGDNAAGNDDDVVHAGDGADSIDAGQGNDLILGEGDDDEIFLDGGLQNDTVTGGETGESIGDRINFSTIADDITVTFTGQEAGTISDGVHTTTFSEIERFQMGTGNDSVTGSDGAEQIIGNFGDDTIIAGGGDDTIFSGFDDDSVLGGAGDDSLVTSSGADTVGGGAGDDQIDLGADDGAADTVIFADGDGHDGVSAFEGPIDNGDGTFSGRDRLDVSDLHDATGNPVNTNDVVVSDDGAGNAVLGFPGGESITLAGIAPGAMANPLALAAMGIPLAPSDGIISGTAAGELIDTAYAGDPDGDVVDGGDAELPGEIGDDDIIIAGGGDDTVRAGLGDDEVKGGVGNDRMFGEAGADMLWGGDGDDTLDGGAGDDTLEGGIGGDVLAGGEGRDVVRGGIGTDTIRFAEGDTVAGGDGDDTFLVTDLGEAGAHAGSIIGGEGDETLGDTLDFQGRTHWRDVTYTNTDPGTGGGLSGSARLADGSVVTFSEIENVIICFTAGTRIATPHGPREVHDIRPGDMVLTRDHGVRPVRWVGRRRVPAQGALAPVRIGAGVLGNDRPLLVSPQHRMLLCGGQASLLFGHDEVLASAKHLVNGASVAVMPGGEVDYVHILFDAHEIVYAEGAPSESFYPGDTGLEAVDAAAREELFTLFPELRSSAGAYGDTARLCLRAYEGRLLRLG